MLNDTSKLQKHFRFESTSAFVARQDFLKVWVGEAYVNSTSQADWQTRADQIEIEYAPDKSCNPQILLNPQPRITFWIMNSTSLKVQ